MEETTVNLITLGLPCLLFILMLYLYHRLLNQLIKAHDLTIARVTAYADSWDYWEQLLTNKQLRRMMLKIETFAGSDKTAHAIIRKKAFNSYISILEVLLSPEHDHNEQNYLTCSILAEQIYRTPIFRNAVYAREEEYPLLTQVMKGLEEI